jgi:flagellar biosynthetic protein FliP
VNRRLRLVLLLGLAALLVAGCTSTNGASDISVKIGDGQASNGNGQFAVSLELLLALTVLSLVPAILMLATSFTRIVVVLSLLRSAIGIPNLPPNQVILGLSFFLTMFVMAPTLTQANNDALQPYLNPSGRSCSRRLGMKTCRSSSACPRSPGPRPPTTWPSRFCSRPSS